MNLRAGEGSISLGHPRSSIYKDWPMASLPALPHCPHGALLETRGFAREAYSGETTSCQETEPRVPGPLL